MFELIKEVPMPAKLWTVVRKMNYIPIVIINYANRRNIGVGVRPIYIDKKK